MARAGLIVGAVLLLGGLGGLALGVERHLAFQETRDRMAMHMAKAKEAQSAGANDDVSRHLDYVTMDSEMGAGQRGSRDLYGGLGAGGVVLGAGAIFYARRRRSA